MKKLLFTIIGSAFTVVSANAFQLGDKLLLAAKLTGDQEVPAVVTPAIGVGSFLLNGSHDSICINVTFTGLSSTVTGAHIRSGAPGTIGTIIKDLAPSLNGNTIKTVLYGTDVSAHLKEYLSGQLYINVLTNNNKDGEIRGQIQLETDWNFIAKLDGSQLVPATNTTAYGLAAFNLSKDSSKIYYTLVTEGVSGVLTQARLNFGAFGKNGALALDITNGISGKFASGTIDLPSPSLIDSLRTGKVYIDLGTVLHPNGTELRGQLINNSKFLYFNAVLNGQQEVPSVPTAAVGIADIRLNTNLDTLWYDVVNTGLSGPITNAHLHAGAPGVAGSVVIDILPGLVGNRIIGIITGSALNKNFIAQLLRGDLYVNLHTAIHPNGEIRGQVYRVARQGYTINLNGQQEVPPVTTNAKGSGIVSINREGDNAHFMIVVDGLVATAGHFHKQVAGQSGDPIFDLAPYYINGGAFGYWKASNNAFPFNPKTVNAFHTDSVYVNIHTAANPNGEIRGQVIKRGECFNDIPIGIDENKTSATGIVLYPNPSSDLLNISFTAVKQSAVNLEIIDVLGKQVHAENFTAQTGNNLRSIFVNKLKNGLYMVKVQIGTELIIERFVKN